MLLVILKEKYLYVEGFFRISSTKSFSLFAKMAVQDDLWAKAKQKQSAKEIALSHLYLEASTIRGDVSSTVMYPEAKSLFALSSDSFEPSLRQSIYLSSAMLSSVIEASTD